MSKQDETRISDVKKALSRRIYWDIRDANQCKPYISGPLGYVIEVVWNRTEAVKRRKNEIQL